MKYGDRFWYGGRQITVLTSTNLGNTEDIRKRGKRWHVSMDVDGEDKHYILPESYLERIRTKDIDITDVNRRAVRIP